MTLKVTEVVGSPNRTTVTLDLVSGLDVSDSVKARIKQDVGEFLVESVLTTVQRAESPVSGEAWPSLSKSYKKKKQSEGLPGDANMEFEGDMLDSLKFKKSDDGVELGFFNKEAWKADGHLKFSGKENSTPMRRFLPGEGQQFNSDIRGEVEKIIADAIADEVTIPRAELEDVSTKSELYDLLAEQFQGLSRAEIKRTVLQSVVLSELLDDYDLLELL